MSTNLTVTKSALERIASSVAKDSLDDLVKAKTRRSLLLIDVSSSMTLPVRSSEGRQRRIDKLRIIVEDLRSTHPVPLVTFGERIELVEVIPEPGGMTPLAKGIDFAHAQGANHIVVVTDGEPDSEEMALKAATRFGGQIDVFFVGDPGTPGAAFAARLAKHTGGQSGISDLSGAPKELSGKIQLCLTDGSDRL